MTESLDWTHLQSFLAVAEHGSLSAAARNFEGSQPTMGRHIASLESDLGVHLFERAATGLTLTATGIELLEHARTMSDAANKLALAATGRATAIAGTIRITASDIVATYVLPEILTALRIEEPEIDIELVASDRTENLLQREADIAIRMYRPTQADVFARKVGVLEIGMFAAHSYLERCGVPKSIKDFHHHDIVGYDRSEQLIRGLRENGIELDRLSFPFRSDNQVVCWQMVVAGFGIGLNQLQVGDAEPRVERLGVDAKIPALPIWLVAHAELKTSRRVRRVFDFLAVHLQKI